MGGEKAREGAAGGGLLDGRRGPLPLVDVEEVRQVGRRLVDWGWGGGAERDEEEEEREEEDGGGIGHERRW